MSIAQMKAKIASQYGASFKIKLDRMGDAQIAAMYQRMLSAGKFN
jgi:hypothetical protein